MGYAKTDCSLLMVMPGVYVDAATTFHSHQTRAASTDPAAVASLASTSKLKSGLNSVTQLTHG